MMQCRLNTINLCLPENVASVLGFIINVMYVCMRSAVKHQPGNGFWHVVFWQITGWFQ